MEHYIDVDSIRGRLLRNSIEILTKDDAKFHPKNGYEKMTIAEKYFLSDIENLLEFFGK